MEPFKKEIETEGAGSFVMPKQPSMQTLEKSIKYFQGMIERTKKKEKKDYYYKELKRLLDWKYTKQEGFKIKSSKHPKVYAPKNQKKRVKYGYVAEVVRDNLEDLMSRKITQTALAKKYNVDVGTLSKQYYRERDLHLGLDK